MTGSRGRLHMTLRLPDRTGAAKMALGYARALRQEGYDVTLVHGPTPVDEPSILPDLTAAGVRTVLEARLERPWDPRLVPALAARVRAEGGLAVIGVNQRDRAPALLAARRVGVPGVLMVQNQHRFHGPFPLPALKARLYARVVARQTSLAVCTSEVVRDEMTGFGVPAARCVVLPNGIEVPEAVALDDGLRAGLRADAGARPGDLLLLNVGRLDPQKGQDVLLDALAAQDEGHVRLALVGSAGDPGAARQTLGFEARLRRQVSTLGLDDAVALLGWRDDVRELLGAADGYVHAARWEGPALPLAVMEAMAAGCPTVFTDCSGTPPGFEDGRHGLLARTGDAADLRRCITRLTALTAEQRSAMGAQGAALVREHYRVEDVGRSFAAMVSDVVGRRAVP